MHGVAIHAEGCASIRTTASRSSAATARRRRRDPGGGDVYEVKLGDDFLMSSRYTAAEEALAELALAERPGGDVVVGGLGLGYTAAAVLDDPDVRSLHVIEALPPVIDWHQRGLLPLGARLSGDARCRLVHGDFFGLAAAGDGFDSESPGRRFDAVLVDIDHAPGNLLDPSHAAFYTPEGLERLARHLSPGGVFGLWSNDPPEDAFCIPLELFTEISFAHHDLPAPKLEKKASTNLEAIQTTFPHGHGVKRLLP